MPTNAISSPKVYYFVNAFFEVDYFEEGCSWTDLYRKAGNLFETEKEAFEFAQKIHKIVENHE